MKPDEALALCPHLRLVHVMTYKEGESEAKYSENIEEINVCTHKICLDYYRRESAKIFAVFSEFSAIVGSSLSCPSCLFPHAVLTRHPPAERASIDEAYFDLTLLARQILLSRYPALSTPPDGNLDAPLPSPDSLGVTVQWDQLGNLVPVNGQRAEAIPPTTDPPPATVALEGSEEIEKPSLSEAEPQSEPLLTWSDVALSIGAGLVLETRTAVRERLGYTCSAGIATNRCLAKLTSSWKKPNNQVCPFSSFSPSPSLTISSG
jgi:DNA polymerase eta